MHLNEDGSAAKVDEALNRLFCQQLSFAGRVALTATYILLDLAAADSLRAAGVLDGDGAADDVGGHVVALAQEVGEVQGAEDAALGELVGRLGVAAVDGVAVAAVVAGADGGGRVGGNGDGDGQEGDEDCGGKHFDGVEEGLKSVCVCRCEREN